jgi:hypothetical protein
MMMLGAMVAAFIVSVTTLGQACTDTQVRAYCAKVGEISSPEDLDRLLEEPAEAAACLIKQLRVVRMPVLKPDDLTRLKDEFRVIWSLRCLRYITHGKEFLAPPGPSRLRGKRRDFLTKRNKEQVPFFAVWMSRDIVYVAPEAAQRAIIDEWKRWYKVEGRTYDYRKATSYDEWYF